MRDTSDKRRCIPHVFYNSPSASRCSEKAFDVSVKDMVYLKQKRLMFLSGTSNVFRQIFSMIPDKPEDIEQIRQKLYPTPSPSTLLN